MNSARSSPHSWRLTSSRTPTMPSAPSWSASSSIRVIASSRAWYIAWQRTFISWFGVPRTALVADVVDRAADHEPERVEAGRLDEQELVHAQVAREEPGGLHLLEPLDARARGRRRSSSGRTAGLTSRSLISSPRSVSMAMLTGGGSGPPSISTIAVPSACTVTIMSLTCCRSRPRARARARTTSRRTPDDPAQPRALGGARRTARRQASAHAGRPA